MKLYKKLAAAALSAAVALAALTGCSQTSSTYTINGTLTATIDGELVATGSPIVMAYNGSKAYTKYEAGGSTVEVLTDGSVCYQRVYQTGTSGAKWTKTAADTSQTAQSAETKSGTMTIDGAEYQTVTTDGINFYCYSGSTLEYIYSKTASEEMTIKITSISSEIDETLFKTPDETQIEA